MKKFKEKILKIGKKKNCFIALLMIALIAIGILTGLNGSKSGEIKANALSAPHTKNLDLNGVRYTYQTSLKELRTYNLFTNWYVNSLFAISENREGSITFLVSGQDGEEMTEAQASTLPNLVGGSLRFINNTVEKSYYDYTPVNRNVSTEPNVNIIDIDGNFTLNDVKQLDFNFSVYKKIPLYDTRFDTIEYSGFVLTLVYVPDSLPANMSKEDYADKCIFFNYAFSSHPAQFYFDIPKYKNYKLRQIYLNREAEEIADETDIIMGQTVTYIDTIENINELYECHNTIDNIKFINNNDYNIITFNSKFDYGDYSKYRGNILLSETNYDENLYNFISALPTRTVYQNFNSSVYFGGNFNNNKSVQFINYRSGTIGGVNVSIEDKIGNEFPSNRKNELFVYLKRGDEKKVLYDNQDRLLYVPKLDDLRIEQENYSGAGLSAQVEDILYNVGYVGNIEEEEFKAKVQEDFENLLKTAGLGAFIGLLIGIFLGNPALGALWGAFGGLIAGVMPLLIDALQAIFGYDFLSGVYNFFKSITQFFVNIVDTIINFLISIITNPFVLILILVVAILYLVYYFKNK